MTDEELRSLAARLLDDPELPLVDEARRGAPHYLDPTVYFVAGALIGTVIAYGESLSSQRAIDIVRAELVERGGACAGLEPA